MDKLNSREILKTLQVAMERTYGLDIKLNVQLLQDLDSVTKKEVLSNLKIISLHWISILTMMIY